MDSVDREYTPDSVEKGNLVVAAEHAGRVRQLLGDLGVQFADVADNDDLGLALLDIPVPSAAATEVESRLHETAEQTDAEGKAATTALKRFEADPASDLDRFLRGLRAVFAGRYGGWTPTLGKNRLLGHVEGGGGHISLAVADPAPSTWRPQPELRGAEPGLGVRVGVLDTSIGAQSWLAGGWVGPAADLLRLGPPYPALAGHGTFVTGLVLRKAPGCVVEFRKVLGDHDGMATSWAVAEKIVELGRTGLDVLNLSLGCFTEDGQPPLVLATAIDRLDPDIVVVAAAGNHGAAGTTRSGADETPPPDSTRPRLTAGDRRRPSWPAALDDVVAVGAADDEGVLPAFTPEDAPWIDVVSNGVRVASTFLDGAVDLPPGDDGSEVPPFEGYARWSGSSFAAALVSGAIAARTKPGSLSARRAWQEILRERDDPNALALRPPGADPRFLPLLDAPGDSDAG
jgi:membrane-anchored mycosin MYCP